VREAVDGSPMLRPERESGSASANLISTGAVRLRSDQPFSKLHSHTNIEHIPPRCRTRLSRPFPRSPRRLPSSESLPYIYLSWNRDRYRDQEGQSRAEPMEHEEAWSVPRSVSTQTLIADICYRNHRQGLHRGHNMAQPRSVPPRP
jgi:hypothetical protein